MSFIDKVRIYCRGGSGGDGCLSFRREKYIEFGGPDGADGGRGGDVILAADRNLSTLMDFAHHPHLISKDGSNGKGSNKTGAGGDSLVVKVPLGTLVYKEGRLLADLARDGATILAARGGRGGRGNLSFKTHKNTAPRIAEKGEPGEEAELELELKLIADVGLIGFPNAGKSSFLARVSNARPKIAEYPFTTLAPHLGLARHKGVNFVVADIPGLIEGAHKGKGLGDEFLRHVERTRFLVHLVDPLGYGSLKPLESIRVIESELRAFSTVLSAKPRLLVVSKMDLPEGTEVLKKAKARYHRKRSYDLSDGISRPYPARYIAPSTSGREVRLSRRYGGRYRSKKVFGISSVTGEGVTALLDYLAREISRLPREPVVFEPPRLKEDKARVRRGFEIIHERSGAFRITGEYLERLASMTNMGQPESVERFQEKMKRIGVDKALVRAGVQDGDSVRIGRVELEWK